LSRAHGGVGVLIGEDPFDGDDVGDVSIHPMVDGITDREQSVSQRLVGRRSDHIDIERGDLTSAPALND
jgi:hypothetical protein